MIWENIIAMCIVLAIGAIVSGLYGRWWLSNWAERNGVTIVSSRMLSPMGTYIFRITVRDSEGKELTGAISLSYRLGRRVESVSWDHGEITDTQTANSDCDK